MKAPGPASTGKLAAQGRARFRIGRKAAARTSVTDRGLSDGGSGAAGSGFGVELMVQAFVLRAGVWPYCGVMPAFCATLRKRSCSSNWNWRIFSGP